MTIYQQDPAGALVGPVLLPPVPGAGILLPSGFVQISEDLPAPSPGMTWVIGAGAPEQIEDNRGVVYDTQTGDALEWVQLGPLPERLTVQAYPGEHYIWQGSDWVYEEAAARADYLGAAVVERNRLQAEATARIAPLQDAADLGEATEDEQIELLAWKRYRIDLNRVALEDSYPNAIDWPPSPVGVV